MRVAWDLQAVTGPRPTGLGVAARLLLDAFRLHCPEVELRGLRPNKRDAPLRSVPDRLAWEQWRLPLAVARAHADAPLDLLYSPALGAPLRCVVPVVAHVHDLISLRYPRQFSGVAGWYWKRLLPETWRRCAAISVSNASLVDEVADKLPYPRERNHIVPYYPDPVVAQTAQRIRAGGISWSERPFGGLPYFITLASHEPRKNIELALRALGALKRQGLEAGLLCIGQRTPHTKLLQAIADAEGIARYVRLADYLPVEQLAGQLLTCAGLIFVSRYEGYGMPPQEAQSVGCPVVLSDIACHRAVYCDPARLALLPAESRQPPPLVATDDADGLAAILRRMLEDEAWRKCLAQAGQAYCATFSPQATAQALWSAFNSITA